MNGGFVALQYREVGDLSALGDREALKDALRREHPEMKPGAVPVHAGVLHRFANVLEEGDLVVHPAKADRTVHVGRVAGPYRFDPQGGIDSRHLRPVDWATSVPRTDLPQAVLNEIGSFLTLFEIANHRDVFVELLEGQAPQMDEADETDVAEAASEEVEERTEDFVLRRLKTAMSDERFEHFVAALLRAMGYHARVTQKSADGGIDVIAHRDELGFEPPLIKVQCKQKLTSAGRPEVQQLMGAVETQEFGLFVTLGAFTREARDAERMRPNLRLIDGAALCDLIFAHYADLEPSWQTIIPLKRRYIPGPVGGAP